MGNRTFKNVETKGKNAVFPEHFLNHKPAYYLAANVLLL